MTLVAGVIGLRSNVAIFTLASIFIREHLSFFITFGSIALWRTDAFFSTLWTLFAWLISWILVILTGSSRQTNRSYIRLLKITRCANYTRIPSYWTCTTRYVSFISSRIRWVSKVLIWTCRQTRIITRLFKEWGVASKTFRARVTIASISRAITRWTFVCQSVLEPWIWATSISIRT